MADKAIREEYKGVILAVVEAVKPFRSVSDKGVSFWADAALTEINRQIGKLGAVEAKRARWQDIRGGAPRDRLAVERDAAIMDAEHRRAVDRAKRRQEREDAGFVEYQESAEIQALRQQIATLEAERDYYRQRCDDQDAELAGVYQSTPILDCDGASLDTEAAIRERLRREEPTLRGYGLELAVARTMERAAQIAEDKR